MLYVLGVHFIVGQAQGGFCLEYPIHFVLHPLHFLCRLSRSFSAEKYHQNKTLLMGFVGIINASVYLSSVLKIKVKDIEEVA
jgi:hypothetical protein